MQIADRVAESSESAGTGTFTLGGPLAGYRAFAAAFPAAGEVYYGIVDPVSFVWETGVGNFNPGSATITRAAANVFASSAAGGLVDFPAGSKVVYSVQPQQAPVTLRSVRPGDTLLRLYGGTGGYYFSAFTAAGQEFSRLMPGGFIVGNNSILTLTAGGVILNALGQIIVTSAGRTDTSKTTAFNNDTVRINPKLGNIGLSIRLDTGWSGNSSQAVISLYPQESDLANFRVRYDGNAYNTNNVWGAISDDALKTAVVDATPKLDDLLRLRFVNYALKGAPGAKLFGLLASEVAEVFPGLVDKGEDGVAVLKTSLLALMAIKGLQELAREVREGRE